jgi:hypothetical protein
LYFAAGESWRRWCEDNAFGSSASPQYRYELGNVAEFKLLNAKELQTPAKAKYWVDARNDLILGDPWVIDWAAVRADGYDGFVVMRSDWVQNRLPSDQDVDIPMNQLWQCDYDVDTLVLWGTGKCGTVVLRERPPTRPVAS